VFEV